MTTETRKSIIKAIKTFLKVCLTVIITLLIIEAGIRVYHRFNPVFFLPTDSSEANLANKFRGKPYANVFGHKLNSKGFKDKEYPLKKKDGTVRVLGIGDSFVYGIVPYPENFLTLLETDLQGTNKQIEVINMGISGSDPAGYLSLLRNEGLEYNPDIVLVFFYIGNDFFHIGPDNPFKDKGKTKAKPDKIIVPKAISSLYTYKTFSFVYTLAKNLNSLDIPVGKYNDKASSRNPEYYHLILSSNAEKFVVNVDGNPKILTSDLWSREFLKALSDITAISDLCRKNDIEFHLILIPEEIQVDPKYQKIVRQYRNFPAYELNYTVPNGLLASQFNGLGIQYFDLLNTFRKDFKTRGVRMFRMNDGHWNIEGNRIAAGALSRYLRANSKALGGSDTR
jgi:hypothetical protein